MSEIKIVTIPEKKEDKDASYKILKLVEDRNKVIAKRFNEKPKDLTVKLYFSSSALSFTLDPNGESMGLFTGYVDCSDEILLVHPDPVQPVFGDNLDKWYGIYTDYSLTKFYLCKKYFPETKDFKMYYRYVSEVLAGITSGNYRTETIKFDLRMFDEGKRYKKEQELFIVFYIMLQNSGIDFIFEHLDLIMKDCDIKKTIFTIYKKSFSELVNVIKKEVLEEKRKIDELEKAKRQAQRDKARNSNT